MSLNAEMSELHWCRAAELTISLFLWSFVLNYGCRNELNISEYKHKRCTAFHLRAVAFAIRHTERQHRTRPDPDSSVSTLRAAQEPEQNRKRPSTDTQADNWRGPSRGRPNAPAASEPVVREETP